MDCHTRMCHATNCQRFVSLSIVPSAFVCMCVLLAKLFDSFERVCICVRLVENFFEYHDFIYLINPCLVPKKVNENLRIHVIQK